MIKKRIILLMFLVSFCFNLMSTNFVSSAVNSSLTWPISSGDLNGTGFSPFKGNITNPGFVWQYVYSGQDNYIQANLAVDDVNGDGYMDACISAGDAYLRCANASTGLEIWNYSIGSSVTYNPRGFPALIVDLFNDGNKQLVQGTRQGLFVLVNGTSGTQIWNVTLAGSDSSYFPDGSPIAFDLNNDSYKEILVRTALGLYALYNNGTVWWNYTVTSTRDCIPMAFIGDVNNDTQNEIISAVKGNNVSILNLNGSLIREIPLLLPAQYDSTSYNVIGLGLVDANQDGILDIAAGSYSGWLHLLLGNGTELWKLQASRSIIEDGMAIGDIDEDGKPELVIDSYDVAVSAINAEDGSILWVYPVDYAGTSVPSIVDVDNDGHLEVLTTAGGRLEFLDGRYGFSKRALYLNTQTHHARISFADINADGFLELLIAGRSLTGTSGYPQEFENKFFAVGNIETARKNSHKSSDLISSNALNWRIQEKNALMAHDIDEYLAVNQTPSVLGFAKISSVNFSLVADDLNNDGAVELIAVNTTNVFAWFSNGTLFWNSSVGNATNPIASSPFISDVDDDNSSDILIQTKTTLFLLNASSGVLLWNYTHASSTDTNQPPLYAFDFDGDNSTEIFYGFSTSSTRYRTVLIRNNKTFSRTTLFHYPRAGLLVPDMPLGDFNKDGIIDGVLLRYTGALTIKSMDEDNGLAGTFVPGVIATATVADINNDTYLDIIVGTKNHSWKGTAGSPRLEYSGNNSGVFALTYNPNQTLSFAWNFSSANISSKIAVGDLNNDNYNEILFGDINNNLYCLNASNGFKLWNISLSSNVLYAPIIFNMGSQKNIVITTNNSFFLLNSSGQVYYNYNNSYSFSYSPIIVNLRNDGKASILIGDTNGNITLFNFTTQGDFINGSIGITILNISYNISQFGYGLFRGNMVNVLTYNSSNVVLETEGENTLNVSLTNMTADTTYTITNVNNSTRTSSSENILSNSNGTLNFLINLGSFHTILVEKYIAPAVESCSGSCSSGGSYPPFNVFINSELLKNGITEKLAVGDKLIFDTQEGNHSIYINKIFNNKVNLTIKSTPLNIILNLGEEKNISLNDNNILQIILDKIAFGKANLKIRLFNNSIKTAEISSINRVDAPQNKYRFNNSKTFLTALCIVIFILFILFLLRSFKKRR